MELTIIIIPLCAESFIHGRFMFLYDLSFGGSIIIRQKGVSTIVFLHRTYNITLVSLFPYDICHVIRLNKSKNKPESSVIRVLMILIIII